jgi:hypothetical protein
MNLTLYITDVSCGSGCREASLEEVLAVQGALEPSRRMCLFSNNLTGAKTD